MNNLHVDWVVRRYFAGTDNTDPMFSTAEETLEVGNFNSLVIMATAEKATNMVVDIETALDIGQQVWIPLTNGTFTLGSREETRIFRSSDEDPPLRWLRYKVRAATSAAWSGLLTLRLMLKR